MNISDAIQAQTYSLKQAVGMSVMAKAMNQDAQSLSTIMDMAGDAAKLTGLGQNIDLKA